MTSDNKCLSQASIYYNAKQGVYQTWYSVRNASNFRKTVQNSYRIKYAESTDLITWKKFFDKQNYQTTNIESFEVNKKKMDIFFCKSPQGEIIELISLRK